MGYGLKFYGANGQLIFDSDFNSGAAETMNPYYVSGSSLVSGVTTTSSAVTMLESDLFFVRVNSGNLRGNMSYSTVNNVDYKTFTPQQSTGYFIARKTSSVGNIVSGTYGLEIFDANSNVTFSTRRTNSSVNIQYIFDDQELTHNQSVWSSSTTGIYVSIGHMFFSASSGTWGCFTYGANSITFDSYLNLGIFGSVSIPNMGSVLVASVRG